MKTATVLHPLITTASYQIRRTGEQQRMRVFRHFPKRRDIPAIIVGFAAVGLLLYLNLKHPDQQPATGFGPEWQCWGAGRGGTGFCMRKSLLDPANQTKTPN
jgi:hypothetical protein